MLVLQLIVSAALTSARLACLRDSLIMYVRANKWDVSTAIQFFQVAVKDEANIKKEKLRRKSRENGEKEENSKLC